MSKMIPFPVSVKPSRVTYTVNRKERIFSSPETGIQQSASRSGTFYGATIEYNDISLSAREIVQSFLSRCSGALNSFKLIDHSNYSIRGYGSNWTDVFSNNGDFLTDDNLNSFSVSAVMDRTILDGGGVRMRWNKLGANFTTYIDNQVLQQGGSYLIRAKVVGNDYPMNVRFTVGSQYNVVFGPQAVRSDADISVPFFADATTQTICGLFFGGTITFSGKVGDIIDVHNLRCSRVALVSNSENLLTRSNEFDHADWSTTRASVESGFSDDPMGAANTWRLYVNSDEASGTHFFQQDYTKIATEGLYTLSAYAQVGSGLTRFRVQMTDGDGNTGQADFNLSVGSMYTTSQLNSYYRVFGKIWDVGSNWYRCQATCTVTSKNLIRCNFLALNSDGTSLFTTTDTAYLNIYGAQLREFPHMGQYVPTDATAVVGTDYQTGSRLVLEGFDADQYMFRSNTKMEIINRYYTPSLPQRSEFRKLAVDLRSNKEGSAIAYIDPPIRNAPVPQQGIQGSNFEGEMYHNAVVFDRPEMEAKLLAGTVQIIEKPLQMCDIVFEVIEDLTK